MEKLESLKIHIDPHDEKLRILPEEERNTSLAIATKSKLILSCLRETLEDLDKTIKLMEFLEKQNKQIRPLRLATIIQKLDRHK